MVGVIKDILTGEHVGLHRTWLMPDGSGKAPVDPARMVLGRKQGGCIRLWHDTDVDLGLTVGEGIETCLAAQAMGLAPVWALIDAGNFAAMPVLPGVEGLTILVDHDKPNPRTGTRAGDEALRALGDRWSAAGVDVGFVRPEIEGHDVNDIAQGAR